LQHADEFSLGAAMRPGLFYANFNSCFLSCVPTIPCEESADVAEERCILMIVHPAAFAIPVLFGLVIPMPSENYSWWGDWLHLLSALVSAPAACQAVLA
jgi:hypothetical protein